MPLTAEKDKRMRAWAIAVVIGCLAGAISFSRQFDAFGMSFQGLRGRMDRKLSMYVDHELSDRGAAGISTSQTHATESENELPWEPYSEALLQELTASQQTVLVDFTADW